MFQKGNNARKVQEAALARKRSNAARKAWATRRAMAEQVQPLVINAAHKAWATRRALADAKPAQRTDFALILASLRRIERALVV